MADAPVTIDKLAFGGSGIGRIDGKVCFVPYSCPGDELSVSIVSEKRSYLTGSISKILTPSSQRTDPVCPLFGTCGGCDWQHIRYEQQKESKRQILADALWRGARVGGDRIRQMVASQLQYGYRSRVQFKLYKPADKLEIGFFRHNSHSVVDAPQGCPIAAPAINESLVSLRSVLAVFPDQENLLQINIEGAEQGIVAIVHYVGEERDRAASFFLQHQDRLKPLTGLYLQTGRKSNLHKVYGDDQLIYHLPTGAGDEFSLGFRPGSFSQVNALQNRAMLDLVRSLAHFTGKEQVLDLYCGNGNFSLPIAREVANVTGIEESAESIAAAVDNTRRNGLNNTHFVCSDASKATKRLADEGRSFDTIIIDPPRSGAVETVKEISRLRPAKIIYISCDPSTLARDCGLLGGNGYQVCVSVPVDMFPQTYHIESVTLLERI
ncbi:23S rRNA (uracil(1939)-C(5))-methyltransferase RlmD [Pelotalea chapellei]|uniref:23S rRNA (Uracil(1939)-C(5))-methyltransferase RlmD n=1 Tax=Pelotalea chapellei TaxID=44671 RepID=A0ABS5U785_9BACT|nr:23S rRNA (uracil(1939)-C(5))-methyltransferase RlmD [Pelotalea chapellei]MBT1071532.1 23S rRNA (uracil(1939)-C(5))-methyltransferase RlmD [Pelotalea chapellei]